MRLPCSHCPGAPRNPHIDLDTPSSPGQVPQGPSCPPEGQQRARVGHGPCFPSPPFQSNLGVAGDVMRHSPYLMNMSGGHSNVPINARLLLLESQCHGSVRPRISGTFPGKIKQLFLTTCINTIYIFPLHSAPSPSPRPSRLRLCLQETEPGNSISQLLAPSILFGGLKIQQTAQC